MNGGGRSGSGDHAQEDGITLHRKYGLASTHLPPELVLYNFFLAAYNSWEREILPSVGFAAADLDRHHGGSSQGGVDRVSPIRKMYGAR
jgi:hypothetical protein